MMHAPSNQFIIGPHIIDVSGNVRTIKAIEYYLLTTTLEHLEDPENRVYFLFMYGEILEVDIHSHVGKMSWLSCAVWLVAPGSPPCVWGKWGLCWWNYLRRSVHPHMCEENTVSGEICPKRQFHPYAGATLQ